MQSVKTVTIQWNDLKVRWLTFRNHKPNFSKIELLKLTGLQNFLKCFDRFWRILDAFEHILSWFWTWFLNQICPSPVGYEVIIVHGYLRELRISFGRGITLKLLALKFARNSARNRLQRLESYQTKIDISSKVLHEIPEIRLEVPQFARMLCEQKHAQVDFWVVSCKPRNQRCFFLIQFQCTSATSMFFHPWLKKSSKNTCAHVQSVCFASNWTLVLIVSSPIAQLYTFCISY